MIENRDVSHAVIGRLMLWSIMRRHSVEFGPLREMSINQNANLRTCQVSNITFGS